MKIEVCLIKFCLNLIDKSWLRIWCDCIRVMDEKMGDYVYKYIC